MSYKFNPFTGTLDDVGPNNGNGVPGGSDTQVQFNDGGVFGGDVDFTYNKTSNLLTLGGDINLNDGGSFTTTIQCVTPTAARTISFPNATGTVGLVAGSSGQLVYNNAGAYAGAPSSVVSSTGNITLSLNGALSATGIAGVPVAVTGTWITGGTAVTTKPQVLIEPTGSSSGTWSTSGTGLGVNAASSFAGRLLDLQVNGTRRLSYDSQNDGLVVGAGIGSGLSLNTLHLAKEANHGIRLERTGSNAGTVTINVNSFGALAVSADNAVTVSSAAAAHIALSTGATERARIDSSGRLLVGTSTARSNIVGLAPGFQLEGGGSGSPARTSTQIFGNGDQAGPLFIFAKHRSPSVGGQTIVSSGDELGQVVFTGSDGTNFIQGAVVKAEVDGTPGANDMPGRLVFSTTADGAANPTERMRIDSAGKLLVGTTTAVGAADVVSPRGFVSRSVAVTLNGTSTVTVPVGCICAMTTDGFPGDTAIFSIKASGGSQGCYVLSQGTAGTIGFGTTSNPSTGTRLNVWISAGLTMSIQDVNQGARTILLTFMSLA